MNNFKIKSGKEIILLLLYIKGKLRKDFEPISGRTRLMKMIFLFEKEIKKKYNGRSIIDVKSIPDFKPYDYGPFSSEVFVDIEFLRDLNFIDIEEEEEPIPEESFEYEYWTNSIDNNENLKFTERFSITELGKEFVSEELKEIISNKEFIEVLEVFKKRCTEISLRALLRYVYKTYPDMTTESKIRDEILKEYYN